MQFPMARPCNYRSVSREPGVTYFKPQGIPLPDLEESRLGIDEYESLRLKDCEGMEQEECASKMGISQPTFHRVLSSARKKVSDSIVNGKALRIEGGNVKYPFSQQGGLCHKRNGAEPGKIRQPRRRCLRGRD